MVVEEEIVGEVAQNAVIENVDNFDDMSDDCNSSLETSFFDREASKHNVPANHLFPHNALYFLLASEEEGKIISGLYLHEHHLLDRRLKVFIINKVIAENPITYKITTDKFLIIRAQLKELFPTVKEHHWYYPRSVDSQNNSLTQGGSLYSYYKSYRCNLVKAKILRLQPRVAQNEPREDDEDIDELDSQCLFVQGNQDQFTLNHVIETWAKSLKKRHKMLISRTSRTLKIRYSTYLNTLKRLRSPIGLLLLDNDARDIVQDLKNTEKIPQIAVDNFTCCFANDWLEIAKLISKIGGNSNTSDLKDFRSKNNQYFRKANRTPLNAEIKALFYLPYLLAKGSTITTQKSGKITLDKEEIGNFFISLIKEESSLQDEIDRLNARLQELEFDLHPYVIFCGELHNITSSFVVINGYSYKTENSPLAAVDMCIKSCIALHTWPKVLSNVYGFLQVRVYKIPLDASLAFIPRATKVVENLLEKTTK
ncbi:hypothetical protein TKK_0008111 [Trichogramma kaykai]